MQKRDAPICFWRMFNTMLSTRDHHSADPPQDHSVHLQIRLHCVPRLMLPVRFQSNYYSAAELENMMTAKSANVLKLCISAQACGHCPALGSIKIRRYSVEG